MAEWVETIQIKCHGLQLLQSLWQPPSPPKKHTRVWELCKTSDYCPYNGSCMTTDITKLWLFFCLFGFFGLVGLFICLFVWGGEGEVVFCWNVFPCIGRNKLPYFNTDQKVPFKQNVFRRVAGNSDPWWDLQLKGKSVERSLFVSSLEASPCKGHPHHHRRPQGF